MILITLPPLNKDSPFELNIRMNTFIKQISESGIAYHRSGRGPALLLIHGVGLRAESWAPLAEFLTDHFEVIIIDLPGHGQSLGLNKSVETVNLDDYLTVIDAFIQSIGLSRYLVCGHSLGALLAIHLASRQPDKVIGLVALNTVYQRSDAAAFAVKQRAKSLSESDTIIGISDTIARWFSNSPSPEMLVHATACEYWLSNNSVEGYAMAYKTFADQRGPSTVCLSHVNCDTVFITGDLDSNSSPEMTSQLRTQTQRNSGIAVKAIVIEGAGHMMPLTHWANVSDELLALSNKY